MKIKKTTSMKKNVDFFSQIIAHLITHDLLASALHSCSMHSKNYRDQMQHCKEIGDKCGEQKAHEKEQEMHEIKETILDLLEPVCIQVEDITTEDKIDENIYGRFENSEHDLEFLSTLIGAIANQTICCWSSYYSLSNIVNYFKIRRTVGSKYYLVYLYGSHSYRHQIDASELERYNGLPQRKICIIGTHCVDTSSLMSIKCLRELRRLLKSGDYVVDDISVTSEDIKKHSMCAYSTPTEEEQEQINSAIEYAEELCSLAIREYIVNYAIDFTSNFEKFYVEPYELTDEDKLKIEQDVANDIRNNTWDDSCYGGWVASTRYYFDPEYPNVSLLNLIADYGISSFEDVLEYYFVAERDSDYISMIRVEASKSAAKCAYYAACYTEAMGEGIKP